MLYITATLCLDERALSERFLPSPGPGGQNVNKVASAVQLRLDTHALALPEDLRARLSRLAGRRLGGDGILTIEAHRFRTREHNREDARWRLVELLRQAAEAPKPRRPTRPSRAARERRLAAKRQRSRIKTERAPVRED